MKKTWVVYPLFIMSLLIGISLPTDISPLLTRPGSPLSSQNTLIPKVANTPSGEIKEMITQVDQARLQTDLNRLTGVEQVCLDHGCYTITNRQTGSEGLQWAKDYVYEVLATLGYTVEIQDWALEGHSDQNLIVKKLGLTAPDKEIYFVAHLDGVNSPAADDNASGAASLLELARILSTRQFTYTIVILVTTGEEDGALGAHFYVNQLTQAQIDAISYVVDVDMLGYDGNNDTVMELFNGSQPVDFVQLLSSIISTYQIKLLPEIYSDCG